MSRLYIARLYLNTELDFWEDGINHGAERLLIIAADEESAAERAEAHWKVLIEANAVTEPGVGVNILLVDGTAPDAILL